MINSGKTLTDRYIDTLEIFLAVRFFGGELARFVLYGSKPWQL
jgi:hypothetical protein